MESLPPDLTIRRQIGGPVTADGDHDVQRNVERLMYPNADPTGNDWKMAYACRVRDLAAATRSAMQWLRENWDDLEYALRSCTSPQEVLDMVTPGAMTRIYGVLYRPLTAARELWYRRETIQKHELARFCGLGWVPEAARYIADILRSAPAIQSSGPLRVMAASGQIPGSDADEETLRHFWETQILPPLSSSLPKELDSEKDGWRVAGERASAFERVAELIEQTVSTRRDASDPTIEATPRFIFKKTGEVWQVRYEGESTVLRDSKACHIVHSLLAAPKMKHEAIVLQMRSTSQHRETTPAIDTNELQEAGSAPDHAADREALQNIAARLQEEQERASKENDPTKKLVIENKIAQFKEYLKTGKGLGGRLRPHGTRSPEERARSALAASLIRLKAKLRKNMPHFAQHLDVSLEASGTSISYQPVDPILWDL